MFLDFSYTRYRFLSIQFLLDNRNSPTLESLLILVWVLVLVLLPQKLAPTITKLRHNFSDNLIKYSMNIYAYSIYDFSFVTSVVLLKGNIPQTDYIIAVGKAILCLSCGRQRTASPGRRVTWVRRCRGGGGKSAARELGGHSVPGAPAAASMPANADLLLVQEPAEDLVDSGSSGIASEDDEQDRDIKKVGRLLFIIITNN